jgi:ribosomal protein L21E
MVRRKNIRTRGKISFKRYFQKIEKGDRVAVAKERSLRRNFPDNIQGRTGEVLSKRGSHFIVKISDIQKPKEYLIHPIHLKKIGGKD